MEKTKRNWNMQAKTFSFNKRPQINSAYQSLAPLPSGNTVSTLEQSQNLGKKIKKHEIELRGAMSEMAIASNGWHEASQRDTLSAE